MKQLLILLSLASITAATAVAEDGIYGATAAKTDGEPTIQAMLEYAIEDEFAARAHYADIIDRFGATRPFTNIMRSEETHIDLLLPLFEAHGLTVPPAPDRGPTPDTLRDAFALGVEAEIANIAMYESFLQLDIPDDVHDIFARLQAASKNHLRAFENGLSRYE